MDCVGEKRETHKAKGLANPSGSSNFYDHDFRCALWPCASLHVYIIALQPFASSAVSCSPSMASVPTAVPASILEVLGAWALRQSQTVPQRLVDAEKILEVLDTASLFDALMLSCPFRDRKNLSYLGGIRCSVEDVGSPAPYAGLSLPKRRPPSAARPCYIYLKPCKKL